MIITFHTLHFIDVVVIYSHMVVSYIAIVINDKVELAIVHE